MGDSEDEGGSGSPAGGSAGGKSGSAGVAGGGYGGGPVSGAGGTGGSVSGAGGTGGAPEPPPLTGGETCDNPIAISLGYGAGRNLFRGRGNSGVAPGVASENLCETELGVTTAGPDRVHRIDLDAPEGGYVTARLVRGEGETAFDAVLYAREACAGPASYCADAFTLNVGGGREPALGGDLLSFPVPPGGPTTYFLYVDGVTALDRGAYELEVSLTKGTCADPVPVFVEKGSPVHLRASNKLADNIQLTCRGGGTADVIYKVTRAEAGVMAVKLQTDETNVAIAVLDQVCDPNRLSPQAERPGSCQTGSDAFYAEGDWPSSGQSLYVIADVGNPGGVGRIVDLVLDPSGGILRTKAP